ncbi:hypothetical protein BV25DRAFT_1917193, partial [Artomyces pyxidatus]
MASSRRVTRSNREFSPYGTTIIPASTDFSLEECLYWALQEAAASEIDGVPLAPDTDDNCEEDDGCTSDEDDEGAALPTSTSADTPPHSDSPSTSAASSRTESRREYAKKKRQLERREKAAIALGLPKLKEGSRARYSAPRIIHVDLDASMLRAAMVAYIGLRKIAPKRDWTLRELLQLGFRLIDWDGKTHMVIVDKDSRIIAVLAGAPRGTDWPACVQ